MRLDCLENTKLRGPGPWINIIVRGPFKYSYGAHLNWLAKIKLRVPGPPGSISLLGAYLNIIVRSPFKLIGTN